MRTSILIPILNYEETLEKVIVKITKLCDEILVVCDITKPEKEKDIRKWLDALSKKYRLKALYRTNERGYGSAIKFGLGKSSGDITIVMHGDECDEPSTVPKMIKKMCEGADIVCGTRFSKGGGIVGNIFKENIARAISLLMRLLSKSNTYDATNGFRAYRTSVCKTMYTHENSFAFNLEIIAKAVVNGLKIDEVPTVWYNRMVGKPNFRVNKEGKQYAKWTSYVILKAPSLITKLLLLGIIIVAAYIVF